MKRSIVCLQFVAIVTSAGYLTVRAQRADEGLAITNVRVFGGIRVIASATVVVANQTVASVGAESDGAYTQIDGTGHTLLPGFIDGHVHIAGNRESLREAARFGVTTVIELLGSRPHRTQALRRLVQTEPSCAEADFFSSGAGAAVKGGHPAFVDDKPSRSEPSEAAAFIDARVR